MKQLADCAHKFGTRVRNRRIHPERSGSRSIVIGFYKGGDLYDAARARAGFVPATRRQVFEAIKHLQASKCPFVNLPQKDAGRWGQGFTAGKMKEAVWLRQSPDQSHPWDLIPLD